MSFKSVWLSRFHSIPLFSLQFICGGSRLSSSLAFAECLLLIQFSVFLFLWVSCHLAAGSRDGIGVRLNPFHKIKNDASFHQEACRGLVFTLFWCQQLSVLNFCVLIHCGLQSGDILIQYFFSTISYNNNNWYYYKTILPLTYYLITQMYTLCRKDKINAWLFSCHLPVFKIMNYFPIIDWEQPMSSLKTLSWLYGFKHIW